jgi:NodT family efflux transporter outer membrane factor (OMF) lipoprotein
MTRSAVALAVMSALTLAGCALKPAPERADVQKEAAPNLVVPPQWSAAGGASGAVRDNWLADLNDAELNALITDALAYNADVRIAAARVEAAAGSLRAAGSALWPQVNLLARGGGKMSGDSSGLQGVGLFASWELDLWGRVRANTRATELQYDAIALDTAYARQSVAALVAKGWLLAIEARLQRDLARSVIASSEQLLSLSQDRLRVGNGSEYEVSLMQASVDSYRDAERNLELAYQNALRGLEILIGRYPGARLEVAKGLPSWSGDIPAGMPSELLERRPDVVAAERRVAAAFYRTEEAKAARLPRISLGVNYTSLSSELFVLQERDNPLFSAGASLIQPLFLGGLLSAQIDVRTAEQKAAIADYGRVTLRVFNEVETALSAALIATQREEILRRRTASNQRALDLSRVRYRVGSGDLRAVQDQQLALYSAQVALLRAQSEKLVQRVNLHLALGGGFPAGQATPLASR